MDFEAFNRLCLQMPGATSGHPFGPNTVVYKVRGKMFATAAPGDEPLRCNLKCDPLLAEGLRAEYPGSVLPGYHMNKRHWNTVVMDGSVPDEFVREMVEDSYDLVTAGMPKASGRAL